MRGNRPYKKLTSIDELVYLVGLPLMTHSASNIGVTLKSWLGVVQGHWERRRSIDYVRLTVGLTLWSCTIF